MIAEIMVSVNIHTARHANSIAWSIDGSDVQFPVQTPYDDNTVYTEEFTLPAGPHVLYVVASGKGWGAGFWEITNECGQNIGGGADAGRVQGNGGGIDFEAVRC